jgi:hypothetical protein
LGSQNNISGKGEKADKKYKKAYTVRDIVVDTHSDRINKKVDKLSGNAKSGSPAWLKYYLSHASKFSNTFCCRRHKGEVYILLQDITSTLILGQYF